MARPQRAHTGCQHTSSQLLTRELLACLPAGPGPVARPVAPARQPRWPQQQQQRQRQAAPVQASASPQPTPPVPQFDWDKLSAEDIESWDETMGPMTPLLDTVNYPVHLKNFSIQQLKQLCKELRSDVVHKVSKTGGHLSSSLGVVELTVAMHYVFNAPEDKMIWDVGHQCYIHKMLTGRRSQMPTIRQTNGLSGKPQLRKAGQCLVCHTISCSGCTAAASIK